jgi:hypothetical protein
MQNVVGATNTAFTEQTEGINKVGFQFEKAKRRIISFAIRLGDRLLPIVERVLDKLEPWLKIMEDLDEATVDQAIAIGKWAIAIGVASKALAIFVPLLGGMGANAAVAGPAMAALNRSLLNAPIGQINSVTKALGALGGVLAALGIGVAVGTGLHETVFDPIAKRGRAEETRAESALIKSEHITENVGGDEESLRKSIAAKQKAIREIHRSELELSETSPFNVENIVGGVTAAVTGDVSPEEQRSRRRGELATRKSRLIKEHGREVERLKKLRRARRVQEANQAQLEAIERAEREAGGSRRRGRRGRAGGGGVTINQNTTNNINARGDRELAKEAKKAVDKSNKRNRDELKSYLRDAAPAEQ